MSSSSVDTSLEGTYDDQYWLHLLITSGSDNGWVLGSQIDTLPGFRLVMTSEIDMGTLVGSTLVSSIRMTPRAPVGFKLGN